MDGVINIVEDVKTKISDDEYMRLMDALMGVHKEHMLLKTSMENIQSRNQRLIDENQRFYVELIATETKYDILEKKYSRLSSKFTELDSDRVEVNDWIDRAQDELNKLRFIVDAETSDGEDDDETNIQIADC
jgi:uncharacterized coiled-coil DUF342 family protein